MVVSQQMDIQGKAFPLYWPGFPGRSLIFVTEVGRCKRYRGFLTKGGGEWLGKELRKLCEERSNELSQVEADLRLRWRDNHASISVVILKNRGGKFAKIKILAVSTRGRSVWICLPAAINNSGWRKASFGLVEARR